MSSVLNAIVKLPRFVKILSTNGIDENNGVVHKQQKEQEKKDYDQKYYQNNRDKILARKKIYNQQNKQQIKEYRKKYWLDNKEQLKLKQREYNKRKNGI